MVFTLQPPFHERHVVTAGEDAAGQYTNTYDPKSGNKRIKITYIVMFNNTTPFTQIQCSARAFSDYYQYFIDSHQEGLRAKILENKPIIVEDVKEFEWIFYGVTVGDVVRITIYYEVED